MDSEDWEMVKKKNNKKVEVTLDSGAGASCWPEKLMKNIPMGPKVKGVRFRAANGTELEYYCTKKVKFYPSDGRKRNGDKVEDVCEMNFHVTDTTRPLAAAMAITKMGNRVVLEAGRKKLHREPYDGRQSHTERERRDLRV